LLPITQPIAFTENLLESTMPTSPGLQSLDVEDFASDEARMRWALGRAGSPSAAITEHQPEQRKPPLDGQVPGRSMGERPRKRFVQDGEVPVTLVNRQGLRQPDALTTPPVNRVSVAHAALANERMARERAERSLAEALATIHELRTKLGHAELARQEALSAAQTAREAAETLRADCQERDAGLDDEVAAERAARRVAEAALQQVLDARTRAEPEHRAAAPAEPGSKPKRAERANVAGSSTAGSARAIRPSISAPRPREPQPVKWWLKSTKKR